jgi:phage-related tail protein
MDKPLTQEWTLMNVREGYAIKSREREVARFFAQLCPINEVRKVIDVHNAALAAARADHTQRMNSVQDFYSKQLAAEREKLKSYIASVNNADRHNAKWQERAEKAEKQLAAEREKLKPLVDALERLQTTRASEHQAIIADALAKVKEGK